MAGKRLKGKRPRSQREIGASLFPLPGHLVPPRDYGGGVDEVLRQRI
jgi:hypothetical protein